MCLYIKTGCWLSGLHRVASSGPVVQAAATANGLHQLLLNCVADTHALLALKAFQPSQQAPSAARVARTDHRQARSVARAARAAAKSSGGKIAGKAALVAAENSADVKTAGNKLITLASCFVAGLERVIAALRTGCVLAVPDLMFCCAG